MRILQCKPVQQRRADKQPFAVAQMPTRQHWCADRLRLRQQNCLLHQRHCSVRSVQTYEVSFRVGVCRRFAWQRKVPRDEIKVD
eukprot:321139-Prymnesium_polylepis.2